MTSSAIEVKGLKKSFKSMEVLKGVDFSVKRGEIFALPGSNGAGKTTTIKVLSTLLVQDGGSASVCGHDVVKSPGEVRKVISLTGQFAAVDGILTGRENLVMIAKLLEIKDVKGTVDKLLSQFGLTAAANKRVASYSGGMARRLDLAMSLIGAPEVIFLDEPTTGLDPEGRLEVWKMIKQLSGNGTTIFLTTQYLDEAEHLADRVAILHEGYIIANDTLDELKKRFPPAKVEYVEKRPSLEEIYLAIVGKKEDE